MITSIISNAKSVNFYFPPDVEKFYVVLKLYGSETINQFYTLS